VVRRALCALSRSARAEAVLGDLAEAHESGYRAAYQVLTVAARRQVAMGRTRNSAAALLVIAPTVLILRAVAGHMSHLATIYGWLYLSNWTSDYLTNPGARSDLWHNFRVALEFGGAVAGWSWAAGFAAGSLARRAIPSVGLVAATLLFATQATNHGASFGVNDAAFGSLFAGWLLPILVRGALIVAPTWMGLANGARWSALAPANLRALRLGALAVTLAATALLDWAFRLHRLR
jgi:hypothetical protein